MLHLFHGLKSQLCNLVTSLYIPSTVTFDYLVEVIYTISSLILEWNQEVPAYYDSFETILRHPDGTILDTASIPALTEQLTYTFENLNPGMEYSVILEGLQNEMIDVLANIPSTYTRKFKSRGFPLADMCSVQMFQLYTICAGFGSIPACVAAGFFFEVES